MAVVIEAVYEGQLACRATHTPSGSELTTDAPVDNGGKGAAFSPTDLIATALGTCVMTTMGLVAERHGVSLQGMTVRVEKEMVSEPSRRVGSLRTVVTVPPEACDDPEIRNRLEAAAKHCPVHRSLHPDVQAPVELRWQ